MPDEQPPLYFAVFHQPGPNWAEGVPFGDQDGVEVHVTYMKEQLQEGNLVLGGPFLDNSGGMMVLRAASLEAARTIAARDPAVVRRLIQVTVKPWLLVMDAFSPGA